MTNIVQNIQVSTYRPLWTTALFPLLTPHVFIYYYNNSNNDNRVTAELSDPLQFWIGTWSLSDGKFPDLHSGMSKTMIVATRYQTSLLFWPTVAMKWKRTFLMAQFVQWECPCRCGCPMVPSHLKRTSGNMLVTGPLKHCWDGSLNANCLWTLFAMCDAGLKPKLVPLFGGILAEILSLFLGSPFLISNHGQSLRLETSRISSEIWIRVPLY